MQDIRRDALSAVSKQDYGGKMKHERRWIVAAAIAVSCSCFLTAVVSCSSSTTNAAAGDPDAGVDSAVPETGTDASLPDSAGAMCDPVKQDCADPSLKCTFIKVGQNHVAACEPSNGDPPAQEGDACTRGPIGSDNCVNGTHCFPNGGSALLACRKLCATDSQCAANAKCVAVTDQSPYFGVCYPGCALFGTDCGGGTCANSFGDNDGVNTFEGCRNAGAAGIGQSCGAQWDCQANMNCSGAGGVFTCHPICDSTHSCADAGACTPQAGLPNGGGACP